MLPFGGWSLLEEGEEDKKDTSKNPHLGEFTVSDVSNSKEYLIKKTVGYLHCCDRISHWDASPGRDHVVEDWQQFVSY